MKSKQIILILLYVSILSIALYFFINSCFSKKQESTSNNIKNPVVEGMRSSEDREAREEIIKEVNNKIVKTLDFVSFPPFAEHINQDNTPEFKKFRQNYLKMLDLTIEFLLINHFNDSLKILQTYGPNSFKLEKIIEGKNSDEWKREKSITNSIEKGEVIEKNSGKSISKVVGSNGKTFKENIENVTFLYNFKKLLEERDNIYINIPTNK